MIYYGLFFLFLEAKNEGKEEKEKMEETGNRSKGNQLWNNLIAKRSREFG